MTSTIKEKEKNRYSVDYLLLPKIFLPETLSRFVFFGCRLRFFVRLLPSLLKCQTQLEFHHHLSEKCWQNFDCNENIPIASIITIIFFFYPKIINFNQSNLTAAM
jgi:hypothetical protein